MRYLVSKVLQPDIEFTLEDQRQMTCARNYFAWQSRLVVRELGRRVIEVGCGIGNFTGLLLDRELVVAVDCEEACVAALRTRYPGVQASVCAVGGPQFRELAKWQADSVVCVNVLEHVADDQTALHDMARVVIPGGVVVLLVPAFNALYGRIDRNLGHYRRYRRGELARMAETAGLQVCKLHYVNTAGFFGWWVNAHVLKRESQSDTQIAVFDRWIVPAMAAVEGTIRPPFGQSLLAVLRRPAE